MLKRVPFCFAALLMLQAPMAVVFAAPVAEVDAALVGQPLGETVRAAVNGKVRVKPKNGAVVSLEKLD